MNDLFDFISNHLQGSGISVYDGILNDSLLNQSTASSVTIGRRSLLVKSVFITEKNVPVDSQLIYG